MNHNRVEHHQAPRRRNVDNDDNTYIKASSSPRVRYLNYFRENVDGSIADEDTIKDSTVSNSSYLAGAKNPRWREQIKLNQQAGTTLTASRIRYDFKAHSAEENFRYSWITEEVGSYPQKYLCEGNMFLSLPYYEYTGSDLVSQANNRALTKFIEEANEARQVLQSGELIGEFKELSRQITGPGKSLRGQLNAYVRSVRNRATSRRLLWRQPRHRRADILTKMVTDTWLEYKLGWDPLVRSIDDVIDYVIESDSFAHRDIQAIQGVGRIEDSSWAPGGDQMNQRTLTLPGFHSRQRNFVKVVVIYRGQVSMSSSRAGYITEKLGFAPDQWIPTLWELVPYSFVLDYFANIGDILYAANFPRSLIPWIMKTTVVESTSKFVDCAPLWRHADQTGSNANATWTISRKLRSMGAASSFVKRVYRAPYQGSIIPDLEFSIPSSSTQWLNLAALFAGGRRVQKLLKKLND